MVNLLFISNHTKLTTIKNTLQPLLKIRIDLVGDFDYGLKDVFEKRPALVFIQDQIAGVTGESVARHIQMLLSAGAPAFIFMHDGNPKAKPLKGLYEYLIDLSQPNIKVMADIQATLKALLGSQWQKLYIPPKENKSDVLAALAVPEKNRIAADQLVDDFISDLGNIDSSPQYNPDPLTNLARPEVSPEEPFQFISSPHDQLAEMMAETARHHKEAEIVSTAVKAVEVENFTSTAKLSGACERQVENAALRVTSSKPLVSTAGAVPDKMPPVKASPAPVVQADSATTGSVSATAFPGLSKNTPSTPSSPADFRIKREIPTVDVATDDLLRAFEENYRSKMVARKRYIAVAMVLILCVAGGGWYLVKQKPHLLPFSPKPSPPAAVPVAVLPAHVLQKAVSSSQKVVVTPLPSFIPLAGHDRLFASRKPGWERYVGTGYEYRVFRPAGKLKAVQILAADGHEIRDPMLKGILSELTGVGEYRVTLREQKLGFQVSHATVNGKADVLIYRKKSAVRALVVSLD